MCQMIQAMIEHLEYLADIARLKISTRVKTLQGQCEKGIPGIYLGDGHCRV